MIISWALILKLMGGKKKSAREAPPPPPGSLCAEFVARLELPHHHRWNSQVTWGGHLAALQGRRVTLPHVDGREVNGGFYPPGPALFIRVGTGYTDDPLRKKKKKPSKQPTPKIQLPTWEKRLSNHFAYNAAVDPPKAIVHHCARSIFRPKPAPVQGKGMYRYPWITPGRKRYIKNWTWGVQKKPAPQNTTLAFT